MTGALLWLRALPRATNSRSTGAQMKSKSLVVLTAIAWLFGQAGAGANEKLGIVVRRLTDACVGTVILAGALEKLVRAGRTATDVCSCAAEVEVSIGTLPKEGFDAWAVQPRFKETLVRCAGAR